MTTYYDILGVRPTASAQEIKAAHRRLAMKFHPDRNLGAEQSVRRMSEDKFKEIQEAYDTLKDKASRAEYDDMLAMLNSKEYYEPPPPPPPSPPPPKVQYCPWCREALPASAPSSYRFCVSCGASLQTPPRKQREPVPPPSPNRTKPNFWTNNWTRQYPSIVPAICLYVFVAAAEILGHLIQTPSKPPIKQDSQIAGTGVKSPIRAVTPQLGNRNASHSMDYPVPSSARAPGCSVTDLDKMLGTVTDPCKSGINWDAVTSSRPIAKQKEVDISTTSGEATNPGLPAGFFTMGSGKADVRRIQGAPTSLTDTEWRYGPSSVYFSNGRVTSWQIDSSVPLMVKMLPQGNVDGSHGFITVGSSKDAVLAVQGTPTSLKETEWGYGPSKVDFRNGRVVGWQVYPSAPLQVKVLPRGRVDGNRDYFTVGSTKDQVLVVQGTPTSLTETEWGYGACSVPFRNRWGNERSSVYFNNGRVETWVNCSDTPLKVRLPGPEVHAKLGEPLAKKGDSGGTVEEYREALRRKPNDDAAHASLGWVLAKNGDLDGAIDEYREALRLNPQNDFAHANLGAALGSKGDWDAEIAEEREALHLNPNDDGAHAKLGWALGQKGDLDGALAEYREALRLNPKNEIAHANLGWVLRDKGDLDGALVEYREKLRLNPDNGNAHYLVGMMLEKKGNYEEALREYRVAHELAPQNSVFREGYERLLKQVNR